MVKCRNCGGADLAVALDLGSAPASNAYLTKESLRGPEVWLPLRVLVCHDCWFLQTEDVITGSDVFTDDYAYFSSTSESWLAHARGFVDAISRRLGLDQKSFVVEVAANDGYLLQYVLKRGIRCLGIEPTASTAQAAAARGIPIEQVFLGRATARAIVAQSGRADLVVANNVLAHVPNLDDFVGGVAELLAPQGVFTVEVPSSAELVVRGQFDTIYHEHFSYFSLLTLVDTLARRGLQVFDVEMLSTHGGSLRTFAQHMDTGPHAVEPAVRTLLDQELARGLETPQFYESLPVSAERAKCNLLEFLVASKKKGRSVVAYGAAAKGNTLLNYSGVRSDLLPFVVDRSPGKVGKYLPGSRIPILPESALTDSRPDVILLLPWNLRPELEEQLHYVRSWGGQLAIAIPELEVF